jgi:hypothetical protein
MVLLRHVYTRPGQAPYDPPGGKAAIMWVLDKNYVNEPSALTKAVINYSNLIVSPFLLLDDIVKATNLSNDSKSFFAEIEKSAVGITTLKIPTNPGNDSKYPNKVLYHICGHAGGR